MGWGAYTILLYSITAGSCFQRFWWVQIVRQHIHATAPKQSRPVSRSTSDLNHWHLQVCDRLQGSLRWNRT